MKRVLFFLFAGFPLFLGAASAGVISRDWKAPGDGLLTFDDVNRREWLDLSLTRQLDFGGYNGVVDELGPGEMFEGFVVGNREDVIGLAQSAGIDTSTFDFATNEDSTQQLIELLGSSLSAPAFDTFAAGSIDEISGQDFNRYVAVFLVLRQGSTDSAGLTFATATSNPVLVGDRLVPFTGVMLFRQVPEPSAVVLAIGSVCGLFALLRSYRIIKSR